MKRCIPLVSAIISTALITSCGFHFRSTKDWPKSLHRLSVSGIQSPFMEKIQSLLSTLQVDTSSKSTYHLLISNYQDNLSNNQNTSSLDTSQPGLRTYSISFSAQLLNGKTIISNRNFSSTISSVNNSNTDIQPRPTQSKIELAQQNLLQQLYFWLKSTQSRAS